MKFEVDRELPIPIRSQLKGLIEYGIATGELKAGEPLPSVRELAERVGVAPMTVSQVYRELKNAGHIEARPGAGTFVASSTRAALVPRPEIARLRQQIDILLDEGLASGVSPGEIAAMVNARLSLRTTRPGRVVSVVVVGVFHEATATYARAVAGRIGDGATVASTTIGAIEASREARAMAETADLVVTLINRQRQVAALLPGVKTLAISFIPAEETRRALASLDPMSKIGVIALFSDFLPIMKAGVARFAPHVSQIAGATLDTASVKGVIERSDIIVYASGTERVLEQLGRAIPAFEYRHIPDPADVERIVLPAVQEVRGQARTEKKEAS